MLRENTFPKTGSAVKRGPGGMLLNSKSSSRNKSRRTFPVLKESDNAFSTQAILFAVQLKSRWQHSARLSVSHSSTGRPLYVFVTQRFLQVTPVTSCRQGGISWQKALKILAINIWFLWWYSAMRNRLLFLTLFLRYNVKSGVSAIHKMTSAQPKRFSLVQELHHTRCTLKNLIRHLLEFVLRNLSQSCYCYIWGIFYLSLVIYYCFFTSIRFSKLFNSLACTS